MAVAVIGYHSAAFAYIPYFVCERLATTPFIVPAEKQKWLLCGYIVMLLVVAFSITTIDHYPILWVYLMNLAVSCLILLLLLFFKFTPNVFVMGMGALMVFTLLLSLSFEKDMTYLIAGFTFMSGASITAQYYLTAQPLRWLLLSWGIGALPQLSLMLLLKNLLFGFH